MSQWAVKVAQQSGQWERAAGFEASHDIHESKPYINCLSMLLAAKTGLEPYEIIAPLGAGDIGEVYETRDTRLERTIAIKMSCVRFTERFESEARAISSLKIATIAVNRL
jgi:serine/threonine protein kinase